MMNFYAGTRLVCATCVVAIALSPLPAGAVEHVSSQRLATTLHRAADDLDAWQLEDATKAAKSCLASEPNAFAAQILAAEVLHQQGLHHQALALLGVDLPKSQAAAEHLADEDLAYWQARARAIRPRIQGPAHYLFAAIKTPHFIIRYTGDDEVVAHYATEVLEAAYTNIGADLGIRPAESGQPIVVEIYPDTEGLAGATGLTSREIETSGTIAVCKFHRLMIISPKATILGYGWADTLAHEYTHLLVSKKSHNHVPIWLHEGIAKYFESRWRTQAGLGLSAHGFDLLQKAYASDSLISFAAMHPSMAKLKSQDEASLAFAEVFTMVQYLCEKYGHGAISELLSALAKSDAVNEVMQRQLGHDLKSLQGLWQKSLATRLQRPAPAQAAMDRPIRLGPTQARSGTQDHDALAAGDGPPIKDRKITARARLGELLMLRGHTQASVLAYQKAWEMARPNHPDIARRLANGLVALKQPDLAKTALREALAQAPYDMGLNLALAPILMGQNAYQEAIGHLMAAIWVNPFNPDIHKGLIIAYQALGRASDAALAARHLALVQEPPPTSLWQPASAQLPEKMARLQIVTDDWHDVCVDGQQAHTTPDFDCQLPAGQHVLTRLDGTNKETLQLSQGETRLVCLQGAQAQR